MTKPSGILDQYKPQVEAALEGKEAKHTTREGWLTELAVLLRPLFAENGYEYPEAIRFACGLGGAPATKGKVLGECFYAEGIRDGNILIFVSPTLDDPLRVADVVTHELCHACLGSGEGHKKGTFGKVARAVGLEGKLTATYASETLVMKLLDVLSELGPYPHGAIVGTEKGEGTPKAQKNRQIKCECVNAECESRLEDPTKGYVLRASRKWIDLAIPKCPLCGEPMVAEIPEEETPEEDPEEPEIEEPEEIEGDGIGDDDLTEDEERFLEEFGVPTDGGDGQR